MVDLHAHVLFDIDDGAKNIDETLEILRKAEKIGIEKIMATPHFTIGDDVEDFIAVRNERMAEVKSAMEDEGINIELKCGAEVYITDELYNEDMLDALTLGDSKFILAEFKYHNLKPEDFLEYIDYILQKGLRVIVAHVERYSFVRNNPMLIDALLSRNVLLQVNATSLFEDSEEGEFAYMLYKKKLIYALGSDIHHVPSRRYKAMEKLNEMESEYVRKILCDNPKKVFGM